jgi:hypothetical protein
MDRPSQDLALAATIILWPPRGLLRDGRRISVVWQALWCGSEQEMKRE